ncbi:chromosome 16 C19orf85 homolog [Amia ocellicauda]|uniref:chromosome 16 C19orf85 homolog n=1 Tax=Amia ocellicauda TaxID=2972642 RepID=UPI00346392AF
MRPQCPLTPSPGVSSCPHRGGAGGRDLLTFVTSAGGHIARSLQRPPRARERRRVNHRRFLHNLIHRKFAEIEAANRQLASAILSQSPSRRPADQLDGLRKGALPNSTLTPLPAPPPPPPLSPSSPPQNKQEPKPLGTLETELGGPSLRTHRPQSLSPETQRDSRWRREGGAWRREGGAWGREEAEGDREGWREGWREGVEGSVFGADWGGWAEGEEVLAGTGVSVSPPPPPLPLFHPLPLQSSPCLHAPSPSVPLSPFLGVAESFPAPPPRPRLLPLLLLPPCEEGEGLFDDIVAEAADWTEAAAWPLY